MSIAAAGQFRYAAVVRRTTSGAWHGRAESPTDPTSHPGLVGACPDLDLIDGRITLRRSESFFARLRSQKVVEAPGPRLVIAITGSSREQRRRLNNQIAAARVGPRHSSRRYVDVDARFEGRDQWLSYIRGLPTSRPHDLWIRFTLGTDVAVLRENEYAFVPPWHLFVLRVYRWGIPGEWSSLAIVRHGPSLTQRSVIRSTELIGSRDLAIPR